VSLHAADLLGDGRTGVVALCGSKLSAFRDSADKPRWTWTLPAEGGRVLDVRPATPAAPTTIIVQSGNAVFGIAGPTGRVRWRCDGPGTFVGLLSEGNDGRPAAAAFQDLTATVCREALPVDEAGRYAVPDAEPVPGLTPIESPWESRPLPWLRESPGWWDLFAVLFLLELAFLWWLRWRATALVLGAVVLGVGVAISAFMLSRDVPFKHAEQHYALTDWYGVLSVIAAVAGGLLAVWLVLSAAMMGILLTVRRANSGLRRRRQRRLEAGSAARR
jgi:hypothetical protein